MTEDLNPEFLSQVPDGDDRLRRVCRHCSFVDYENPKLVAGSVVTKDHQILLCKRAIEPRKGFWTLPAGYMEKGETIEEAAAREAREEACAEIEIDRVLAMYTIARLGQVQVMFRGRLVSGIAAGPESEAVALYDWADIPWAQLAFPTVVWALTQFAESRNWSSFAPYGNPPGSDDLIR
ncbi:MAG: NUDIX hydrolase [Pseudomonadota bacterium]